jgi:hypothetical protein
MAERADATPLRILPECPPDIGHLDEDCAPQSR